jgi:predicted alpha-1,2-mannosidase
MQIFSVFGRFVATALVFFAVSAYAESNAAAAPVDEVNPFLGTAGHGHMYPGATVPFGLVQLSPDTRDKGWDGCSGYHYSDSTIMGFTHTHLTGTGGSDLGDVLLMPVVGAVNLETDASGHPGYQSRFSHDKEKASPGYYQVFLDDPKVLAELTATARVGFHRYTFPKTDRAHLVIDLVHGIGCKVQQSDVKIESSTVISGHRKTKGWTASREVWFVMEFSKPFKTAVLEQDGRRLPGGSAAASGVGVKGWVDVDGATEKPLLVKVAISPTSLDEAKKNMAVELPGWDFEGVRAAATKTWNDALSVIDAQSADPVVRRTFYSNLYGTLLAPILANNADGSYRGEDLQNHAAPGFQTYSEYSLWDTYRAENPLLTLIQPQRVNDFVSNFLVDYQQLGQHSLPTWPLWANETWCMIGYHSVPVIVDAYFKGLLHGDPEVIYAAMRDTAMQPRKNHDLYQKYGYIPMGDRNESVSTTLECAYDDWCIGQMAAALGKTDDAALFQKRAQNYRNLYDSSTKFMRARAADGTWRTPFVLNLCSHDYTEADAWQYRFAVQQDVPGLIALMGGDAPFVSALDALFTTGSTIIHPVPDISGLVGQYSQGDEQCHHVAYLFNYAGAPWKTQERVRQVAKTLYTDKPDGQCGNADCGEMCAWYILSAMGFFPVNPATGVYVIGSPVLDKATLHLDPVIYGGKTFTMTAQNNSPENIYVQSASLNGQPLTRSWITHKEITNGGELILVMGPQPNKNWGAAPADRPPGGLPLANLQTSSSVSAPVYAAGAR